MQLKQANSSSAKGGGRSLLIEFNIFVLAVALTLLLSPLHSTSAEDTGSPPRSSSLISPSNNHIVENTSNNNDDNNNSNDHDHKSSLLISVTSIFDISERRPRISRKRNKKNSKKQLQQIYYNNNKNNKTSAGQLSNNRHEALTLPPLQNFISLNYFVNNYSSTDDIISDGGFYRRKQSEADVDYLGYTGAGAESLNRSLTLKETGDDDGNQYWALALIFFPVATIFGNSLVVLSVVREKNLKTVTNYFVMSLAAADLTVAVAVMPIAVYYEVTKKWIMSKVLCDAWVAMDVLASTASILNLVAIAIDRFIAVTQPLKYARHKNSNRIYFMLAIVWLVSIAVASPIMAGLNDTPTREKDQCAFNNEAFLISSSMFSFYIPCIAMIGLYYKIFQVIRSRAIKSTAAKYRPSMTNGDATTIAFVKQMSNKKKTTLSENNNNNKTNPSSNKTANSMVKETSAEKVSLISARIFKLKNSRVLKDTKANNAESDNLSSSGSDSNSMLMGGNSRMAIVTPANNNNNKNKNLASGSGCGAASTAAKSTAEGSQDKSVNQPVLGGGGSSDVKATNTVIKATSKFKARVAQANSAVSNNKERKVTKTLAIVLIVFLVCWTPFFSVNNIWLASCKIFNKDCSFIKAEHISFLTWLGYLNSLLNPIIYTIFNIEFRKAFTRILADLCCQKKK